MGRNDQLSEQARILAPYLKPWIFTEFYEESTYTPTYLGGTTAGTTTYAANGQVGIWTRLGRLIFFHGRVEWTAATGTGNAQISLPFTTTSGTNFNYSGGADTTGVTFANSTPTMLISASTAFFVLRSPLTNAAPTTVQIEAAGAINFSGFFEVSV